MSDELRRAREYGRAACRRKYRLINVVCECGYALATERHHQNGDTTDNRRENVRLLCDTCHTAQHTGDRWHADRDTNRWLSTSAA